MRTVTSLPPAYFLERIACISNELKPNLQSFCSSSRHEASKGLGFEFCGLKQAISYMNLQSIDRTFLGT